MDVGRIVVSIAGDVGNDSDKGTRWMEDNKLTFKSKIAWVKYSIQV